MLNIMPARVALATSILTVCLLLSAAAFAQAPPLPRGEAALRPLAYENDTTFEFGIYDSSGQRFASAYYRVLKETTEGRSAYRFKYVGRNERLSESSECWVAAETGLPMRSTRKVINGELTTFFDVAYDGQKIIYRKKRGAEGKVEEQQFPAQTKFYDYESLMWLVPQLEFGEAASLQIGVFDTLNVLPMTLVVSNGGATELTVAGTSYPAQLYSFSIGTTPYKLYAVNQNGQMVPARIDMSKTSFVNLSLSAKKVKNATPGAAKPEAKPKAEKAKPKARPEEEEEAPPGENPLGPPPSGGRF